MHASTWTMQIVIASAHFNEPAEVKLCVIRSAAGYNTLGKGWARSQVRSI